MGKFEKDEKVRASLGWESSSSGESLHAPVPYPVFEMSEPLHEAYRSAGNDPWCWWICGQNLIVSSNLLRASTTVSFLRDTLEPTTLVVDDIGLEQALDAVAVFGPSLMLRAFGVEAFLKAFFLDAGGTLIIDGHYQSPTGKHHDLTSLALAAGFVVSKDEQALLAKLEYWTQEGRYPVQSNLEKYNRPGARAMPLTQKWDGNDESIWMILLKRLASEGQSREERWRNARI